MVSPLRAVARILVYLALTLPLMPLQAVAVAFGWRLAATLPVFYHRLSCRIFGFDVRVRGDRSTAHPVLFVANHTSYADIAVLASVIPVSFIAKAEVASWPLFGSLARLQRSVFIERRGRAARTQRETIRGRFEKGDDLVLFAEGTTSDGMRVLPFKSALFAAARTGDGDAAVAIQPVSIAYTRLDGMPLGRGLKPFVAWYGDMSMASHAFALLGLGRITVEVIFHPEVAYESFATRRALSEHCRAVVAAGVSRANAGRIDGPGAGARSGAGGQAADERDEEAPDGVDEPAPEAVS